MTHDLGWDDHAQWWIDGFTNGVDAEYEEQIIPLAKSELLGYHTILDVGCGDGQIARALSLQGSLVLGIDPTALHIEVAQQRGGGAAYLLGSATALPVDDETQDAVVACLVFEHIDELEAGLAEISRVLKPGGQFSFFLNHPLLQTPGSGWIDDHIVDPPEQYWRLGPYLVETDSLEEVESNVFIRFIHRPLSRYINALHDVGFVLERMLEPSPPEGFLARAPEYVLASTIPRLLYLRLRKPLAQ
jgi:SAM-dependent methyltransferase